MPPATQQETKREKWIATVPPEEILPIRNESYESSVKGIYVVGDVTGFPLVKIAAQQGAEVVQKMHAQNKFSSERPNDGPLDLVIIGGGPAGLAAAAEAETLGLRYVCLERSRLASTVRSFPAGKMVYAEPAQVQGDGQIAVDDDETREAFLERVDRFVENQKLKITEGVEVDSITQQGSRFEVVTKKNKSFPARFVIIAIGRQGQPRMLEVPGADDDSRICYRLHSPDDYDQQDIVIVGGGNSAIEAALMLMAANRVTLVYRGDTFHRLKEQNRQLFEQAEKDGRLTVLRQSQVASIQSSTVTLRIKAQDGKTETRELPNDKVIALLGTLPPIQFLREAGLELDGLWTKKRFVWMSVCLACFFFIYFFAKLFVLLPDTANGKLLLPLSMVPGLTGDAPWHAVTYVLGAVVGVAWIGVVTVALLNHAARESNRPSVVNLNYPQSWLIGLTLLGIAIYLLRFTTTVDPELAGRGPYFVPGFQWIYLLIPDYFANAYGLYYLIYFSAIAGFGIYWAYRSKQRIIWKRNLTLIAVQWTLWWGIPTFLVVLIGTNPWTPLLARSLNAWPLNMSAFRLEQAEPGSPAWWQFVAIAGLVWAVFLTFVVIPLITIRWGKIYCSYICSCGALAETVGNAYRHRGPKGDWPRRLERFGFVFIPLACLATIADALGFPLPFHWYNTYVGVILAGAVSLGLYPFLGQRIWCRMWCPLAFWMNFWGRWSKFKITPEKGKCIDCNVCNQYCQMGIDIKGRALRGEPVTLANTPCVACAECVARCPMEILHLGDGPTALISPSELTFANKDP